MVEDELNMVPIENHKPPSWPAAVPVNPLFMSLLNSVLEIISPLVAVALTFHKFQSLPS